MTINNDDNTINHASNKILGTRTILKSMQRNINNRRHARCQHTEFFAITSVHRESLFDAY